MTRPRKPKKGADPGRPWRLARPVLGGLLTLVAAAGAVWVVWLVGEEARRRVGPRDRYEVRFADIDCAPPPGTDRDTFLVEVRFASGFPETFQLFAPDRDDRLRAAFAAHPWVESVGRIDAGPAARVAVALTYRTPALAVVLDDGGVRVVDARGVLLPLTAKRDGLPALVTPQPAPIAEAGHAWPNESVRRALALVAAYHPRTLERTAAGWQLRTADGKVLVVGP